ncbi:DUF192 domain-containing protein [Candidatus Gracilibacteria bacterium]|nr:DUF192 domain-containing protein [Candidatus Gracilibacteria bacterium]MCF7819153.1 DUF192 domain-containing protein [Candidatus Gracilibacteria bacterium]
MGCEYAPQGSSDPLPQTTVKIGEQSWEVEIAREPWERQRGLMHRDSLGSGKGMFFVFQNEDFHEFWMQNTFLPLDVIWISSDKKVVDVQTLQPCKESPCPNFKPNQKALFVLEVNAGEFEGKEGDIATWKY